MKLSIILPVYNVAPFIPDCLDSLLSQDIPESEYEIICVNDGSMDNSEDVIKKYQKDNPNIILVSKENGGVSNARNTGLNIAKGEYIWFIDPDDFIQKNCFKFIIDSLQSEDFDVCNVLVNSVEEKTDFLSNCKNNNYYFEKKPKQYGSCCAHIVKRPHVAEFDETLRYGEDYLWEFEVCSLTKKQITLNPAVYFYRQRQNSAMHTDSAEKQKKHIDDLHSLAISYQKLLSDNKYQERQINDNIKDRIGLCVQNIIISLLLTKCPKCDIISWINTLKYEKLYPYKTPCFLLKPKKNPKAFLRNLFSFFLNYKWFVSLILLFRK